MRYRRILVPGGTYFFTLTLARRRSDLLVRHISALREAMRVVKERHPFSIIAMVVMPDHLHAIWRLPQGDADYPLRWSLIKSGFSRRISQRELLTPSRLDKGERGIWQRRYWEHQIRDERDLQKHVDYIHFNPVKHGIVNHPAAWPHSTLLRYVANGLLPADWGGVDEGMECGER